MQQFNNYLFALNTDKVINCFNFSDWLVFCSRYNNIKKYISKSCINTVKSLFSILSTLVICWDVLIFCILSIVFCKVTICYVIDRDNVFFLVILEYEQKISQVWTTLFKPTKFIIVLKDICSAKLSWIPEISVTIIKYTYCKGL